MLQALQALERLSKCKIKCRKAARGKSGGKDDATEPGVKPPMLDGVAGNWLRPTGKPGVCQAGGRNADTHRSPASSRRADILSGPGTLSRFLSNGHAGLTMLSGRTVVVQPASEGLIPPSSLRPTGLVPYLILPGRVARLVEPRHSGMNYVQAFTSKTKIITVPRRMPLVTAIA